jgi:nucleoid DNA-binding protein
MGRRKYTPLTQLVARAHEKGDYSLVDRAWLDAFCVDVLNELVAAVLKGQEVWIPMFGTYYLIPNTPKRSMKPEAGLKRLRFRPSVYLTEAVANLERRDPNYVPKIPKSKVDSIRYGQVEYHGGRPPKQKHT